MTVSPESPRRAIVIGAGPAGLMAAEALASGDAPVDLYDAMPSVGRKFLLAGKGGLNLTHAEPFDAFVARYGARRDAILPMLRAFGPDDVRAWAHGLGITTFVGSSGRVFPTDLKAAPLLRAWLHRLRAAGVRLHMRHRWTGAGLSGDGTHRPAFDTARGPVIAEARAVVLALGGGSWARLGSDGAWVPWLREQGVPVAPLLPSNCGFDVWRADVTFGDVSRGEVSRGDGSRGEVSRGDVSRGEVAGWSDHFRSRFAGHPLKNVAVSIEAGAGPAFHQAGEFVVTDTGVEGSLIYAASSIARDAIANTGHALLHIDLLPARGADVVRAEVARPRGSRSLSTHLKSRLGIDGVKAALLRELLPRETFADAGRLAQAIKALPLGLRAARPIDEAISSAGGVRFDGLDEGLMVKALPGVFCAGEMLDWEAPTGGYLLTACLASGRVAGRAVARWLDQSGVA